MLYATYFTLKTYEFYYNFNLEPEVISEMFFIFELPQISIFHRLEKTGKSYDDCAISLLILCEFIYQSK
ncbi:hypothetical protein D0817_23200 [Flavobacterium cupreum]|uniref:Uncharacterized protein n=1 Tax=Flavobacterium cupreum TaxID=2133766 RepID=A0A434A107_9FLAO|nr:hypothetical protein D0817_23200 [Flavobacterium cupreum]